MLVIRFDNLMLLPSALGGALLGGHHKPQKKEKGGKMKKLLLIFALAGTVSAQEYLLPIGENVDRRETVIGIGLSSYGVRMQDTFVYKPEMGALRSVIESRLRKLADNFSPLVPEAYLNITFSSGPWFYESKEFPLQKLGDRFVIPSEMLEVKLRYGEVTLELNGVTKVELRVRGNGREEHFSSDGGGQGSVCFIQTVHGFLGLGLVILAKEYVNPQYRAPWITEGEVILWENERFVEFNILDGKYSFASAKAPDFLESLRAPALPAPHISRIARVGHTTEITVSAETSATAHLEFSETLNGSGNWYSVPKYPQPLSLQTGLTTFTHTIDAPASFYRLRISSPSPQ